MGGGIGSCGNVGGTHFSSGHPYGIPVDARQDVDQELGVVGDVALLELGVFVVEREAERGGLAGFDGAGEEGGCQDFHVCGWEWWHGEATNLGCGVLGSGYE